MKLCSSDNHYTTAPCETKKEHNNLKKHVYQNRYIYQKRYIYQNELDKAYFQLDMSYGDFKDLARVSRDKAFNFAKYKKYDGYQRGIAPMIYRFFDKSSDCLQVNLLRTEQSKLNQTKNLQNNFINQLLKI